MLGESKGLKFEKTEEGYIVTGIGTCRDICIVIPPKYRGMPVVGICASAFESCTDIESVDIPGSVRYVGESAFESCVNLSTVVVGNGVGRIGPFVFYGCSSLAEIIYGGTPRDWQIMSIDAGNEIFKAARKYSGPDMVEFTVKYYYDEDDDSEEGVVILPDINPGSHRYPHGFGAEWRFNEHLSPLKRFTDSLNYNFRVNFDPEFDCNAVPESNGLRYAETEGGYVVTGKGANKDEFLRIPARNKGLPVLGIAEHAFRNRSEICHVIVPETVRFIGKGAFAGCISIETMYLPFVGGRIAEKPCEETLFGYIFGEEEKSDDVASQCCAPGYHDDEDEIRESLIRSGIREEDIDDSYFFHTYFIPPELRTVVIRGGQIFNGAFEYCANIKKIVLPESTTAIGDCAFCWCSSLEHINIPEKVTSIGICAFYRCCLDEIRLSENVKKIGEFAFNRNDLMTVADIPGVGYIEKFAFSGCFDLEHVRLSKELVYMDECAFRLTDLKEVILPKSLQYIGKEIFCDCDDLKRIFYEGTESSWHKTEIERVNEAIHRAEIYFFRKTKPTGKGKFWHYDAKGNPVIWREAW
ncbi:MAG: leucine-rich repeat domain-containing protein [Clostridia bacterium]|nr:leucine-rich repeat domain-containing protein [Clostridia bacterium]